MNRRSFFRNVAVVAAGAAAAVKGLDVAAREPAPAATFAPVGHTHGKGQPNLVRRDNSSNFTAGTITANSLSSKISNVSGVLAESSVVWTGEQWTGPHTHSATIPALTVQPAYPAYGGMGAFVAPGEDVDAALAALIRDAREQVGFGGITRVERYPHPDGSTSLAVEFLVQG